MSRRLLVALPCGALLFWMAAAELAALLSQGAEDPNRVTISLLLIGGTLALGAALLWGLWRGRRWALGLAMALGALFSLPFLVKSPPQDVPALGFGIVAGLCTLIGAFLSSRAFMEPTRAPAPPAAARHPAP